MEEIEKNSLPKNLVEWKKVGESTYRYRIPECGWLVKVVNSKLSSTLCFVPDPDGKWLFN